MPDYGALETDALIAKMEKRMNTAYRTANTEMNRKLRGFMKDYNEANKTKKADLKAGKITKEDYEKWKLSKAGQKRWLDEMVNTLSEDAILTNAKAMSIVRGFMPEAYAINRNYGAFQVEKGALIDTSFTLYDAHTVERIVEERPNLLPQPKPDIPKEMRWHKQKINNAITQGILQGESIPDIAARLQAVTDMDNRAAIRNARTATTAAQNAGRVDSYKDAQKMGIDLRQQWVATLDGRTRDSHRMLDGEIQEVGKKFSNGCKYPGDPEARPAEIYNCRCTLIAAIKGFERDLSDLGLRNSKLGEMGYEKWKTEKLGEAGKVEYQISSLQNKLDAIPNQTYSGIWKNDVTLSDYDAKKDSIQAKNDYYESEYNKLMDKAATGDLSPWEEKKLEQIEKNWAALGEFEKNGKLYSQYSNELKELQKQLKEMKGVASPFSSDAYTSVRKNGAFKFDSKREADLFHRKYLDSRWGELSDHEKYSVFEYTRNSNPMNKPLSGYHDSWNRSSFLGVGNTDWGHEDSWRYLDSSEFASKFGKNGTSHVDYYSAIQNLTTGIDKMEFTDDVWLVRGSDVNGLAGLFEGNLISFDDAKDLLNSGSIEDVKAMFEGQTFQSHSFMSTGIASGTGFSGNVSYSIYAPAGTHGIYAEPQSYFGSTVGMEERLYRAGESYYSVGGEAEVILQRGTGYRVASIESSGSGYHIELEVVGQPDYFRTGAEETFNAGATIHKK